MDESAPLSRRRIDAAGDALRRHRNGESVDPAVVAAAFETLARFRRCWEGGASPVVAAAEELRRIAARVCSSDAEVSERIKREDRILDKLVRIPSLALSRLQDIGGCRVVVPAPTHASAVRIAIRQRWSSAVRREHDYVVAPKPDGYRAVHVVVEQQACLIEIQIRTRLQNAWARTVERLEYRTGAALRAGAGDPALQLALRTLADVLAESEPDARGSADRVSDGVAVRRPATRTEVDDAIALLERAC